MICMAVTNPQQRKLLKHGNCCFSTKDIDLANMMEDYGYEGKGFYKDKLTLS